jgi:hypothetical protein
MPSIFPQNVILPAIYEKLRSNVLPLVASASKLLSESEIYPALIRLYLLFCFTSFS